MSITSLAQFDAAEIHRLVPMVNAVDALENALIDGLDPSVGHPRSNMATAAGQLLSMPAEWAGYVGVKLVTIAPGNTKQHLPRTQGVYVIFDAATLTPTALLDATVMTHLRTPAMSAVAARALAPAGACRLVIFGTGPQAQGHVESMQLARSLSDVVLIGRDQAVASRVAAKLATRELSVRSGSVGDVRTADIIVCATTAREPLFDGAEVKDEALVIAVGSHEPDARELDSALMGRATVVVEDKATALREAGDVVMALSDGVLSSEDLSPEDLVSIAEIIGSGHKVANRPVVFKSVGMAWQDLVVATEVIRRAAETARSTL